MEKFWRKILRRLPTGWKAFAPGRLRGAAGFYFGVAGLLLLSCKTVTAQEALQNLKAGEAAAQARGQQMQNPDYTVKSGDFRMLLTPSFAASYNDNVNVSENNAQADYILTPAVGINSIYQLTQRNLLHLDVNIGYSRYLRRPGWSTFVLNSTSGTGLFLELGIKDVTLNVHDWISYVQDASQDARASENTTSDGATFGTFQNTVGIGADWELNKARISAGYDHQDVIATDSQDDQTSHASEMFYFRPSLQVHPQATVGLETTAAFTTYNKSILTDNDAYTAGGFFELRPDENLSLTARGGFTTYKFDNNSNTNIATSDQNSWYAGISLNHRLSDGVAYSLSAGHQMQLGVESDLSESWYFRPSIQWSIIKDWDFVTAFFYEHGKQGVGNVRGNFKENYDWYGGELSLNHPLTESFSLAFNYRLTLRSSDQPDSGYTQNVVGFTLIYHPK
jgi:hypothetical protein